MVQDRQLPIWKEKFTARNLIRTGKLIISALILLYIYNAFRSEQKGISDLGRVFSSLLRGEHAFVFFIMLVLVPVNWALESLKWQQLAGKVVDLTFRDALKGTLAGLAVGVAAPAQLGDTIGRIAALKSGNRMEALGAAVVSNGIQFYASVCFGALAWLRLSNALELNSVTRRGISILLVVIMAIGLIVALFRQRIVHWKPTRLFFIKTQSYLRVAGEYNGGELSRAFALGLLRYLVFVVQFVLSLSLFNFPVGPADLVACVALILLSKTLIPAINIIGDLGLREFTALIVFSRFHLPAEELIAATFLVWVVNVLGPMITGLVLIWKNKWKFAQADK